MGRGTQKKPRVEAATSATPEAQQHNSTTEAEGDAEGEGEGQDDRKYDGLSFWVASKTVSVKLSDLETEMKKVFLSAGFSIEECSVSLFYIKNYGIGSVGYESTIRHSLDV